VLRNVLDLAAARAAGMPAFARGLVAGAFRPVGRFAGSPLIRMFVNEVHATLVRVAGYACALGVMALVGLEVVSLPHKEASAKPAPSEWVYSVRPIPAFALSIPEFSDPQYAIRRHLVGGGRKDVFSFNDESGAAATVEIYRPGAEANEAGTSAALPELRLSAPIAARAVETKFGLVAIEEFTEPGAQGARACVRFSRQWAEPRLIIGGQFCNGGPELIDRGMVACALDNLTLLSAGSDPKVGALFARAELRRSFCGQQSVILAATPKRPDWIEAARDPSLRGQQ
jgi:hypothetical protein